MRERGGGSGQLELSPAGHPGTDCVQYDSGPPTGKEAAPVVGVCSWCASSLEQSASHSCRQRMSSGGESPRPAWNSPETTSGVG